MWRASSREVVTLSNSSISHTLCRSLTCSASSRIVPHPPDLLNWVRKEGGFVHHSLKIAHIPSYGLGLLASHEIPQGSDLIVLPPHIPLKFDVFNHGSSYSPILTDLALHIPEELWTMRLGLKLLQERARSGSFWWPYINNLPDTYSVPIFFQRKDILNLQYSPLINQINKRCRFLFDFEKQVKEILANVKPENHPFGGQDINASSLGWAMSAVSSRAFRLHGDKHSDGVYDSVPTMLPLIDMCNHSFYPNAKISQLQSLEDAKMLVKVVAEKHINRDVPLEINYGNMSNDLFLLDYGFVISSNPYDTIELKYDPHLLDAASAAVGVDSPYIESPALWQLEILSALQLAGESPSLKVYTSSFDCLSYNFVIIARMLHQYV
ncbi:Histone-lysine N-methyltransferase setd3 [Bienertia sinuspersici]